MKGIQIFEKDKKRIITFLRCGHRYVKEITNKKGTNVFKQIEPNLDEQTGNAILFPYEGKTYFILRDPYEHLISSIIFTIGSWHMESIRQTFTDFYLLTPQEKLQLVVDEIYYQRNNHHWLPKRYELIYKILCNEDIKNFDFVLLKNLKSFVEDKFKIVEEYNPYKYGYQMYTKNEILEWISLFPPKNYDILLNYCKQETYYYNLLINKKIKKEFCHDYVY